MNIQLDGITPCDIKIQSLKKQVGMTKEIRLQVEKQIKDCNAENEKVEE